MFAQIKKSFQETQEQAERDLADALRLPWKAVVQTVVGITGFVCAVVGLLLGLFWGVMAGALIGVCLGYGVCAAGYLVVHVLPTPFAWLARRLGYT
jgi:hypothetical protein